MGPSLPVTEHLSTRSSEAKVIVNEFIVNKTMVHLQ